MSTIRRNSRSDKTPTKAIEQLNKDELEEEKDRCTAMLNSIAHSLPDKGEKLKNKLDQINKLLQTEEVVCKGVRDLSLEDSTRLNIRKKSIADANAEARKINQSNTNLLKASSSTKNPNDTKVKVQMMTIDEALQLQKNQIEEEKNAALRRKLNQIKTKKPGHPNMEDDISLAMDKLNIDKNNNDDSLDQYSDDEDEDSEEDDDDFGRLDSAYEDDDGDRSSIDEEEYQER
ncbi:hypothetical protein BJ944DRAFT_263009 [Cunninghamella echinulata]|nr:hypothetical protein BJ944DRAFT_263009 [Cunninghamella echinulata]